MQVGQSDDEIAKVISEFSPDIVGISVLFSNFLDSAHDIARITKKVNNHIKVILGGNHISNAIIDYKYAKVDKSLNLENHIKDLENKNIDFALTGEGELQLVKTVNAIVNKQDISKLSGLVKKIGEKKYIINPPNRIHDLNLIPRPARHLVNMEKYFKIGAFHSPKSRSNRVLSVMCSRGCPEKCTFCTTPDMWGAKVRWRSTENIISEITNGVRDFRIGELQFEDDTITARKKNLLELCSELEKKVGIPWCTPNGVKVNYHEKTQ